MNPSQRRTWLTAGGSFSFQYREKSIPTFSAKEFSITFTLTHSFEASIVRTSRLEGVSTVRGSGWVADQYAKLPLILSPIAHPSATADGTDLLQVRF